MIGLGQFKHKLMYQYIIYQLLTFSPTAKVHLQALLKHNHLELGFDQVRVYKGQKGMQIFTHGRLRILAEDYIEKKGRVTKKTDHVHLYEFAIPPFIYCKEHNRPTIEVIHYILPASHRPVLSTVGGHTPFSLYRISLYYLYEHTKEHDISKEQLKRSYLLDPMLELPNEEIDTLTLYVDLLSYIVLESKDDDNVIIEILSTPESYALHFNDKVLLSDIDTRINEDTGKLLYKKEILE